MRRLAAIGIAMSFATAAARAQTLPSVQVAGPLGNPLVDGIGTFTVSTANFSAADLPLRLQLQVSTNPGFDGPLFADTIVNGTSATIVIPRLLPASGQLYWRAFALTARAGSVPSEISGPRAAPTHLRLISPNNPAGQSVNTLRPTFTWSTSRIPAPFGAWEHEFRIEETATGLVRFVGQTTDTTLTLPPLQLESNASYRWSVTSRLRRMGDSLTVASLGTFVIVSDDAPLTTVMFDPFPSPFPSASGSSTCVWFDLSTPGPVTLTVLDMRGLPVKRLVPAANAGSSTFPPDRYGRPAPGASSGCDDRFSWDGTDAAQRVVPPGVYVILLRAGGRTFSKRVVFRGR
jgi:hypothetical protein